ncbi:MAG: hypothetical protein V8R61_08270 [Enterocloster sp.]
MKRLKAAVIGSGFIGAAHVEALKRVPGVDVVALVDIGIRRKRLRNWMFQMDFQTTGR